MFERLGDLRAYVSKRDRDLIRSTHIDSVM